MLVVLEVASDLGQGKKLWLQRNQSTIVGRNGESDFVLPRAIGMSRKHFQLTCDHSTCTLRDLDSVNGTQVNRQRVEQCVLRNGDEIIAGDITFKVTLDSTDTSDESQTLSTSAVDADVAHAKSSVTSSLNHRVGNWLIQSAPDGWETDVKQGLRFPVGPIPTTLAVGQVPAPMPVELTDHAEMIAKHLGESEHVARVLNPEVVDVSGADDARQIVVEYAPVGGIALMQLQVFAQQGGELGTATFVSTAEQWEARNAEFDQIIRGLVFDPSREAEADDDGMPIDDTETVELK